MEELMNYCNNYFYNFREYGKYIINNKSIKIKGKYIKGQYIKIVGSILNDGVYKVDGYINGFITIEGLEDEVFEGYICSLSVPKNFIKLSEEINQFKETDKPSSYTSESFGNYSYSKATNKNGIPLRWTDVFMSEIKQYRKIYDDFRRVEVI